MNGETDYEKLVKRIKKDLNLYIPPPSTVFGPNVYKWVAWHHGKATWSKVAADVLLRSRSPLRRTKEGEITL